MSDGFAIRPPIDARWLALTSPPELFGDSGACHILILGGGGARNGEVEFHSPLGCYLLLRVDDRAEGNKGLSTSGSSSESIREKGGGLMIEGLNHEGEWHIRRQSAIV